MGFLEAINSVIAKYAKFSGRSRRSEYWWWTLGVFIAVFVLKVIEYAVNLQSFPILSLILFVAIFIPSLAVTVRRLKDTGHDWYWVLVACIPLVNFLVLYFLILDSDKGGNKFGPSPKE